MALAVDDLASALRLLVGDDQEGLEGNPVPLYLREDRALVVGAMPTFDGRVLVPPEPPAVEGEAALVDVS